MITIKNLICMLMLIFLYLLGFAQEQHRAEESDLKVTKMVFCTEIIGREPLTEESSFANDTPKVYCFTKIEGAQFDMQITHKWFYQDSLMAEVPLSVRSAAWRTYSSKKMIPEWTGTWRVIVVDDSGKAIREESFEFKKEETD